MPSKKAIEADQFAVAMQRILFSLRNDIDGRVPKAVKAACAKGTRATKEKWTANEPSTSLAKGPYKTGFAYKVNRESRSVTTGVIYNRKYPGLVHLLEKGHNTIGGGRAQAKPHLAVAETQEELWKQLSDEIDEAIANG